MNRDPSGLFAVVAIAAGAFRGWKGQRIRRVQSPYRTGRDARLTAADRTARSDADGV
jgi:hypothetical protein